jgi:hypothetical protein
MKNIILLLILLCGLSFQNYAQVLFEENFEDTNFEQRGWYDNLNIILSTKEHIEGSTSSAEFHFLQGETLPQSGNVHRVLFTPSEEVCLRYYVKYSATYTGSNHAYHPHEFYFTTTEDNKFIGPAYTHLTAYIEQNEGIPRISIQDGRNVDTSNVGTDLSRISENRSVAGCNGDSDGYGAGDCYVNNNGLFFNGKVWKTDSVCYSPARGEYFQNDWHYIEAYIKLNSIVDGKGIADGKMEYWYDGKLLMSHNNILFRTSQHPNMLFNQFLIGAYIGGGSPIDQTFWVDDLKITTAPSYTEKR